ncbi:arginine--tRNA ligase [Basilea psittacipulmonis]|uniref:Arginine--tRNA ligase n=1 Tax=Basilea psittacipulmonis DSM 24701 TaxID=1072685 RepID=A0A077DFT2_9BURK|nr:arginine--tRNA ligase [Basilea psittacipulmonis]AIL32028.1 arginine--tRNA ligase [Basilea psittacipulmonis DSM 24701]
MLPEVQTLLIQTIEKVVHQILPDANVQVNLARPKQVEHGDVATNIAMQLAKPFGRNPRELAQEIVDRLLIEPKMKGVLDSAEVAGPGFINLRLSLAVHQSVIHKVLKQGQQFGRQPQTGEKIMIEFVSANPTGPLHLGHARQAVLGDCLSRLHEAVGYQVHREFYYNDAGNQINNLVYSVQARIKGINPDDPAYPADGYRGDYIVDIANDYMAGKTVQADGKTIVSTKDADDVDNIRAFAVAYLRNEQDLDLKAINLKFDQYYLESSLYVDGKVDAVVRHLINAGFTYEKEGALWLKTTELGTGDDKDRVMRKSDGSYTYFVPDIAYHVTKWERGYHHDIQVQGTDHHGTVARLRAGLQGMQMGIPKDYPSYCLHKMVKVVRNGQEVKISKRAGSYVTMRDLIDWVGQDAVRFFMIQRRADTEFVFDIDLALQASDDNPVYYVQYAHARICKLLRDSADFLSARQEADTSLLTAPTELALMRRLAEFPSLIMNAAKELSPHLMAYWLLDLAADLHSWYGSERIMVDDETLKHARLTLADVVRQVLSNGLNLLGVSSPEQM